MFNAKNEIAYCTLLKKKKDLEAELEAIEIALSCFDVGDKDERKLEND